jgi:hypothetical protein
MVMVDGRLLSFSMKEACVSLFGMYVSLDDTIVKRTSFPPIFQCEFEIEI